MNVRFQKNTGKPETKLAEVIVSFDDPKTQGCEFHGFGIWRNSRGELFVGLPRRTYISGTEERHFNYVRSADPEDKTPVESLKQYILDQYNAEQ